MSEKKQPVDLGLLEEDDEFEEFPAEDWTGLDEDEDAHVWEDNWDDDNVEDDFSNQLRFVLLYLDVHMLRAGDQTGCILAGVFRGRAELEKHGYKMETS
ncbi:26S proteasome complex subunit SEM1 isoform 1-T1 [Sylvia borin]